MDSTASDTVSSTASDIVTAFVAAWNRVDMDGICALLADDVFYHNIPMDPIIGKQAAMAFIAGFPPFEACDWQVHHQVATGNIVMNERTDRLCFNGVWVGFPIAGIFEIRDGKIAAWRDYFDLAMFEREMAKIPPQPAA
ncbi:limonene-1,2-epoxide hydrolase family protein [Aquisediminimonas sediminicola]|uniref:limonene-1,2-epoxide hydrolase family protein n=1 Tax=Alteraquisediminimonas sediminicola TaxID=2676787 RepID=UPI001C8EA503|nr:limonene-1,2-epoxide hydrolase family protein [Aquisediminimonas sediminicola]